MPFGFVLAIPVSAFDVRRNLRWSVDLYLYIRCVHVSDDLLLLLLLLHV